MTRARGSTSTSTNASTVVFLGPSLSRDEARRLLPGATLLPPAAVGDVYLAASRRRRPARIAIVDGYFERMAAVWHKEILFALERGIAVYGAASMGALRAAELAPFGMIGVGRVCAAFRAGRLTDDDEVAVMHAPAEHGYAPSSEAMVNLREGLRRARAAGVVSPRTHDALVALAKRTFYRDRTWETLIAAGRAAGLPRRQLDALAAAVARRRPDVKAADARALLRRLARERRPAGPPRVVLARTWFWERFVELIEARHAR
jgi:hypothetical protein